MDEEQLQLYYPVKPFGINQVFGANPEYYARFKDRYGNPEKGHMGVDLYAPHGTPVYAACDGWVHYEKDAHGGEGMVIRTAPLHYRNPGDHFNVIHWHLCGDTDPKYPTPIALDGKEYKITSGDLIGYADNTGAPFESSGAHLHLGLVPLDSTGNAIESMNGFNGCIDPTPYFTGKYAQDVGKLISLYTKLVELLKKLLGKS